MCVVCSKVGFLACRLDENGECIIVAAMAAEVASAPVVVAVVAPVVVALPAAPSQEQRLRDAFSRMTSTERAMFTEEQQAEFDSDFARWLSHLPHADKLSIIGVITPPSGSTAPVVIPPTEPAPAETPNTDHARAELDHARADKDDKRGDADHKRSLADHRTALSDAETARKRRK